MKPRIHYLWMEFMDWMVYDKEKGGWGGIREDAPEEMKKQYAQWLKDQEEASRELG